MEAEELDGGAVACCAIILIGLDNEDEKKFAACIEAGPAVPSL